MYDTADSKILSLEQKTAYNRIPTKSIIYYKSLKFSLHFNCIWLSYDIVNTTFNKR